MEKRCWYGDMFGRTELALTSLDGSGREVVCMCRTKVGCEAAGLSVSSVREPESCVLIRLIDLGRLLTQTWCREGHGAGMLAALGVYTWGCLPLAGSERRCLSRALFSWWVIGNITRTQPCTFHPKLQVSRALRRTWAAPRAETRLLGTTADLHAIHQHCYLLEHNTLPIARLTPKTPSRLDSTFLPPP